MKKILYDIDLKKEVPVKFKDERNVKDLKKEAFNTDLKRTLLEIFEIYF